MRSHEELERLAAAQFGVVTFAQLRELGFSKGAISRSTEARRLLRIHRGVYAVGHRALSAHGRALAAVLACGDGALLSHRSAAWLHGLQSWAPREPEVTVANSGHRRARIRLHRTGLLTPADACERERLPTTSLARTMLDIAAEETPRRVRNAVERAERLGLLDLDSIDSQLARRPGVRGAGCLRRELEIYRDPIFSRARSERLFRALVKRAGLPMPAINTFVAGHEIDAYWEQARFAVEVEGWEAHRTRAAFENDHLRQENLKLAGIDSVRITARRIEREPAKVGQRLAILLAQRQSATELLG
jgi:very-short-patch-repair endonuclease